VKADEEEVLEFISRRKRGEFEKYLFSIRDIVCEERGG
jgi:hypothetical protein